MIGRLRALRSIRARVTAGSIAVLGIALAFAIAITSLLIRDVVERELIDRAADAAGNVAETIATQPVEEPISPRSGVVRLQVVDAERTVVASSPALRDHGPLTEARPEGGNLEVSTIECQIGELAPTCLRIVGFAVPDSAYGDVVAYAAVSQPPFLSQYVLEAALVLLGLVVLVLVGSGIWWAAGRTLRPVEEIRAELERITAADLSRRVPEPRTEDEIADLAHTVNETLARLESAAYRQQRFISDASHELRTPIAGLQMQVELALEDPEGEHPRWTLRRMLRDTQRLQRIADDLLQLARLDSDTVSGREPVDLGELVGAEVSRSRFEPEISVDTAPDTIVTGDRTQLSRLLINLLANASRHAAGRIRITVTREDGQAVLRVHDDGPGIPPGERERIFERFARLDESRHKDPGGTGLGLSIAREIARMHGGSLAAEENSELGGAVFVLRLPLRRG